uniref:PAP-associated domain-containing protein n=1 Tax=Trichuris muris TaxID=70415 RepID=A0A5S6QNY8_TRIMR
MKDWLESNGIEYRCSRRYLREKCVYKCCISVGFFDITVSSTAVQWKMAKKKASFRVCARLLALNALAFSEVPGKFHKICKAFVTHYSRKLSNGKNDSSASPKNELRQVAQTGPAPPGIDISAHCSSDRNDQAIIDLTMEASDNVIDLTGSGSQNVEEKVFSSIHSTFLRNMCPSAANSEPSELRPFINRDPLVVEIITFYKRAVQPRFVLMEKLRAVQCLQEYIWQHPRIAAEAFVVGSTANGLGNRHCDVDLCLVPNSEKSDEACDRNAALKALRYLSRFLRKPNSPVCKTKIIPARVPIIRCQFRWPWNYAVDINWNNLHGIYNTHLLHYYAQADQRFPMLYMIIHHWACELGVCDSLNGYLSSYSWALLLIHFLQCGTRPHPPVLPCLQLMYQSKFSSEQALEDLVFFQALQPAIKSTNRQSVGELLMNFFYYYGSFDFSRLMISVRLGSALPKVDPAAPIYIEEPYDRMNTARSLNHEIRFLVFRDYLRKAYLNLRTSRNLSSMYCMV